MIVFSCIVPHPPFSVSGSGRKSDLEKLENTLSSLDELGRNLKASRPDTLVIISPHARMESYNFVINSDVTLRGNLEEFGVDWNFSCKNDLELADKIVYTCEMNEIFIHFHQSFLDHGSVIPIYHLTKNLKKGYKVLHLSFSLLDYEKHYSYGRLLGRVFSSEDKRIAIIASGDLSHRLSDESLLGYKEEAKVLDRRVIDMLGSGDIDSILKIKKDLVEAAAECGLRSFLIMLGIISYSPLSKFKMLSYEYPFGVGYLCAKFE